eukprot:366545-Chlamydomonas_euryale.AAC.2
MTPRPSAPEKLGGAYVVPQVQAQLVALVNLALTAGQPDGAGQPDIAPTPPVDNGARVADPQNAFI